MSVLSNFTRKRMSMDITYIVIFNAVMLFVFHQIDFLETLYAYSQQFEEFELDEIIPLFFTISVSLLIFIVRRYGEMKTLCLEAQELSNRDHLTGLNNRRFIQDMFHVEVQRIKRNHTNFALLIIDVDDFKNINDTYGHNIGDTILVQLSNIMLSITRTPDVVSRWGGEEFLILCPETNLANAIQVVNRMQTMVNNYKFHEVGSLTVSIGVVEGKADETFEQNVHRADLCLYQAKHQGKNCYVST